MRKIACEEAPIHRRVYSIVESTLHHSPPARGAEKRPTVFTNSDT
jgi:hypothetical protein